MEGNVRTICGVVVLLLCLEVAYSVKNAPLKSSGKISKKNAMIYLTKFGYTEPMETSKNRILSSNAKLNQMNSVIKDYQSFVGIPRTGKLDKATVKKMNQPRCGLPDRKNLRLIKFTGSKWPSNDITYSILNMPSYLDKSEVLYEIARAFRLWSDVTNLRFTIKDKTSRVNIAIKFENRDHDDGSPFDGPNGVVAHALGPPEGDTHFDAAETWTINGSTGMDLFLVAAHEFGHALGLDHSNQLGSLMYPVAYAYKDEPNFKLKSDDLFGIQSLYGKKTGPKTPTSPSKTPNHCTKIPVKIIAILKGRSVAISGHQLWTISETDRIADTSHVLAEYGLPGNLDAGFSIGKNAYFFKGTRFWTNNPEKLLPARNIKDVFPFLPEDLDAALVIDKFKGKYVYFFKGHHIWMYNVNTKRVESGYPKQISDVWPNLPNHIDGAMNTPKGATYFTRGNKYYLLNVNNYTCFQVMEVPPPF